MRETQKLFDFFEDKKILNPLYLRWEKLVLKEIDSIIQSSLNEIDCIQNDEEFKLINNLGNHRLVKLIGEDSKEALISRIKDVILSKSSEEFQIHLWLKGWIDSIEFDIIKKYYDSFKLAQKAHILNNLSSNEQISILTYYVNEQKWDELFELFEQKQINKKSSTYNTFLDDEYWIEDEDKEIRDWILKNISEKACHERQTKLYLNNYYPVFNEDYIFATLEQYTTYDLETIISKATDVFKQKVIFKKIEIARNFNEIASLITSCKSHLNSINPKELSDLCLKNRSDYDCFHLWKEQIVLNIPFDYINKILKDEESDYWIFKDWLSSKLIDILPEKKIDEGIVYEISNFKSIVLINNNGILDPLYLPIEAQTSPIKSCLVQDFNDDGFKDLLLVGNHYGVEVETVRYDAGHGSLFLGDGKNNFRFIPPSESGVYIPKDSRNVTSLKTTNQENIYLTTNNNSTISLFK